MSERKQVIPVLGSVERHIDRLQGRRRPHQKRGAGLHSQREIPPLLSPAEQEAIEIDWNDTSVPWPQHLCIHEVFEMQADRTPDAIAVTCGGNEITYQELNKRANQLASRLAQLTSGMDVPIGICMEPSLEMVVGVLAILKSGAAYFPLDPAYPQQLLQHMLKHVVAPVILTKQRISARLPGYHARLLFVDSPLAGPETNLPRRTTPGNLACVFYTSGVTGTPKPIAVPHRPLVNLMTWYAGHPAFSEASRTAQFASLSFHLSCQEMFSTWATGGTLVLIPEELRSSPKGILGFLDTQQIERLFLQNTALQQLADVASRGSARLAHLRNVVSSGGPLRVSPAVAKFFEQLGSCTLHNHYGTAEAHVATCYSLSGSPAMWPSFPPIGRPIANTKIYLLDTNLRPVSTGVPGEIYVGGECLAQGYLHRVHLTAEQFIPDPFSGYHQGRLYKTGDLARYREDGWIEYIGRTDQQVKNACSKGIASPQ